MGGFNRYNNLMAKLTLWPSSQSWILVKTSNGVGKKFLLVLATFIQAKKNLQTKWAFLNINEQALAHFLRLGVIKTLPSGSYFSRACCKLICSKSVEEFDLKYVSLKKLSLERRQHYVSALRRLEKGHIHPFFDEKYASRIYTRSEVDMHLITDHSMSC